MSKKDLVIDAEFHHIPIEAAQKVREMDHLSAEGKKLQAKLKDPRRLKTHQKMFDVEYCLQHMDECGVDMALAGHASWIGGGLEVCKAMNDGRAMVMREYPDRFIPLALVPYHEGQKAIDELDRAVTELGLKGVMVLTSQQGVTLDDEKLKPFFQKVNELNIPVAVHPTTKRPLWGGEKYFMSGSVSREYDIIKSFVEVLSGVLPEFPDLNFLFAHYGGGVPFLLGRIMSWYAPENMSLPKQTKTIREFEDFGLKPVFDNLFDRFYFTMSGTGGWMPAVKQALLVIKPQRLCFATDFPHEMDRPEDLKAYIKGIEELDIPAVDMSDMFGGNIKRLFKV